MSSVIGQLYCDDLIRERVVAGHTHQAIASELQRMHPWVVAGLSRRSVTRHCAELHGVHYSSRLDSQQLEGLVEQSVYWVSIRVGLDNSYLPLWFDSGRTILWSAHTLWIVEIRWNCRWRAKSATSHDQHMFSNDSKLHIVRWTLSHTMPNTLDTNFILTRMRS